MSGTQARNDRRETTLNRKRGLVKGEELQRTLEIKPRDELNVIARKLGIQKFRHNTKEQLVKRILSERRQSQVIKSLHVSRWERIYFHLFGWSSVVSLILALIPFISYFAYRAYQHQANAPTSTVIPSVASSPLNAASPIGSPTPSITSSDAHKSNQNSRKDQTVSFINRAQALYNEGKYQEAIAWCDKALAIDPTNSRASNLKSRIIKTQKIISEPKI
ncbi:MAG: Tetratricopeptide repeat [Acidobacteriota bacterium]|jgi:tetratricopeptide (TPR) repeat protein